MFKLLAITLLTLVMSIAANPHAEKPTTTADTTTAKRVLVSPRTNFTLSSSTTNGLNSTVVLELWSERMISGNVVAPSAGHRLLNEHEAPAANAAVAPAMSYTYRINGKFYINDQNLYKQGARATVNYSLRVGLLDKTYTTVNGPLTQNSTPAIDWMEMKYLANFKSDKGAWYCNDKWTNYTIPLADTYNASTPRWQIANVQDDKQNCVIVNSFNTKNIVDDSHLFLTTQFNRLFDTGDKNQDIKLWPGMPVTLLTQVGNALTSDGSDSPIKQFDYLFTDFAQYDHVEHDNTQVTIIIIVLLAGSCCIIGTCYFLDNRKK